MRLVPIITSLALLLPLSGHVSAKGEEAHQKIVDSGQVYDDPELQAYINRIGQSLVANSDKPKQKFTFTVLDTEMINAFAAPGGYIYISRGLLPFLDSEEELAGVIGHEIAHAWFNDDFSRMRWLVEGLAATPEGGLLLGFKTRVGCCQAGSYHGECRHAPDDRHRRVATFWSLEL